MSKSRTTETRITETVGKLANNLGDYFEKTLQPTWTRMKKSDQEWLKENVTELVGEFKAKTMSDYTECLKPYALDEKDSILKQANRESRTSRPWRPSRNPELDVRAHLVPLKKVHMNSLDNNVALLDSELRSLLKELHAKRKEVKKEYAELESFAQQLLHTNNTLRITNKSCMLGEEQTSE